MNTVFKLYYQAWLVLAVACAIAAFYIWETARPRARTLWTGAFAALFALSMVYPLLAFPDRAGGFQPNAQAGTPTLDGWRWVANNYPDDYAAIEWARKNIPRQSVILEASGPEYSFFNRISAATGIPTVLGWGGHELQWRGNYDEAGPRASDVEQIYRSRDINQTRELLAKYEVNYVFVGGLEREQYNLNTTLVDKFRKLGELVFDQGTMKVFHISRQVNVSLGAP